MELPGLQESATGRSMNLTEHLSELRARIIRSVVYAALGTIAGWYCYSLIFRFISTPILPYLTQHGSMFLLTGVAEGFMIKMQVSVIVGIILALPFITGEIWGFVAPGLTGTERRAIKLVAPLSILLFVLGISAAYVVLPQGIKWLVNQNPPGAAFMPSVSGTLLFILKMELAFGLVFQMPVILMFLAKIGLVNSGMLKRLWRQAVVAIAVIAAVATPSSDAFTMLLLCVPMIMLYVASIGLTALVQKNVIASGRYKQ